MRPAHDEIIHGEALDALACFADESFQLVYIDPPFNTGKEQRRRTLAVEVDANGDREGFGGRRYRSRVLAESSYRDSFENYLGFLEPHLGHAHRLLDEEGTLYFHVDYREAHYCKLLLDEIFGRDSFLNEIVWAYDYGGKPKRRWPAKHDTILVYVKDPKRYFFDSEAVEREPYMAPGLVTPEKAARGKLPTDCYSADTEILTAGGWIPFPELRDGDLVASVTPEREIVYCRPTKLHRYRHTGEMHWFKSKTIDLMVTPNHSLYVRPKHEDTYRFIRADELRASPSSYYSVINQLSWHGVDPEEIALPEIECSNWWSAKPRELPFLARPHSERLLAGLMAGDGHVRCNEAVYSTTSSALVGYNSSITLRPRYRESWRPTFAVRRRISHESTIWPARHRRIVSYDGFVYCCTVEPHHTLIVRRNGRPVVCGNCWWHTIVPTNGAEKTGYPTQKPEGIVRRMMQASSRPGDWCLDFFAGSGTLGAVAKKLGRHYVLVDSNPEAVRVMRARLDAIEAARAA